MRAARRQTSSSARGRHVVAVPVSVPATGANFVIANPGDQLAITGAITFVGAGSFNLSGAGTLEIGNGGTTGSIAAGTALTLSGGTLSFKRGDAVSFTNNLLSGSGALAQNGTGRLTVSGANNHSGGNIVNAGTFIVGSATALGASTGPLTVNDGTLDLNEHSVTVGALSGTGAGGVITDTGTNPGVTTLIVSPVAATITTFNGSITGTATRGIALEKAGAAASYVILAGTNTLTGPTLVRGGALGLGNPAGVSMTGSVVLGNGTAETFLIAAAPAQQFGPASVVTFSNGALNAKFQLRGTNQTVAGLDATPAQSLAILQNDELTTPGYVATPGPGVLTIDAATDHSFYGIIRDRISTVSLVKNGTG